jgi:hypothetical protein
LRAEQQRLHRPGDDRSGASTVLELDVRLRGRVPAMTRAALVVVALLGVSACHPAYQPPSLAEPHATLKLRVVYHHTPGTQLNHLVLVNGHNAGVPEPVYVPGEIARAIPVRLEGTRIDVRSTYSHTITTMRMTTQTYSCGVGRTCSRMVTVPVTTRVTDAHCAQAAGLGPQRDAVYLLQYDYYGHGQCTLACMRQWPQPDGTFRNGPCDPPPPAP